MRYFLLSTTFLLCCLSCSSSKKASYNPNPSIVLQEILNEEVTNSKDGLVGVSLTVISPKLNIDFSGAAGYDSLKKEKTLDAAQPFRIASLTKVYVAAAIMRLREKGKLSLEDPITKYISQQHVDILRNGGYTPEEITIRHCLTHSSGLYDYAEVGPEYIEEARKDPNKRWTRTEQIQFAMDHGKPHAAPGVEAHYSDTGYVLLGETIETLTGEGLAGGLRSLLKFDPLGMNATYLESLEERPQGLQPNVKRYLGTLDATSWDNSIDLYGGGGLVANTRDLSVFLQALFNGEIYENEDSLDTMLLKKDYDTDGKPLPIQRLGFGSVVGKESGIELYLHSGFWGTLFIHIADLNCSIAINNTNDVDSGATQRVIDYVIWLHKNQRN